MKINKVLLTQPNYSVFEEGKNWELYPYSLAILNACIKGRYKTELFDPNLHNLPDDQILSYLKKSAPDVVAVTTASTQYARHKEHMTALIRKALPNAIVIEGGILSTVLLDLAMKDKNVDYWVIGEGEFRLPALLDELQKEKPDLSALDGLAYYGNGAKKVRPRETWIEDLDAIPFQDYGNLNMLDYGNNPIKYSVPFVPKQLPYAIMITSRGCPFNCSFCAAHTVSGKKVRMRSSENILAEIDMLYKKGIREIVFLDDHLLFDKQRAIRVMKGIIERKYNLTWKAMNLSIFSLDDEILGLMKQSGFYCLVISIESGNQHVLDHIMHKPQVRLDKVPGILKKVRAQGFDIMASFVYGMPGETWDQIRETFAYGEKLINDGLIDYATFHPVVPFPKTEITEICKKKGYLPKDFDTPRAEVGLYKSLISTDEFTSDELQILRAFEWDRIHFRTKENKEVIARMQGITLEELEAWRKTTRRQMGVPAARKDPESCVD